MTDFERFYEIYPRKTAKARAEKAWAKLNPPPFLVLEIFAALEQQKRSHNWLQHDGQFIPYPASWLNGRRWEDTPVIPTKHLPEQPDLTERDVEHVQRVQDSIKARLDAERPAMLADYYRTHPWATPSEEHLALMRGRVSTLTPKTVQP